MIRYSYIISVFLFCLGNIATSMAETATVVADTKLYQRPSIQSNIISSLQAGTQVEALTRQGGWKQISHANTSGWVRSYQLRSGIITIEATASDESGGFFSNLARLSRKASGLFSREKRDPKYKHTATIGVRGLSEQELKNAEPDYQQLKKLESFRSSRKRARKFAASGNLKAIKVSHMPKSKVEK